MPTQRIIAVAVLNIPGPDTEALVTVLKAMSEGKRPVNTDLIAKVLNCTVDQAEYGLNLAQRLGLAKHVSQGWIAG
jgi:hypothetical protein